jgi:hypothetical protein
MALDIAKIKSRLEEIKNNTTKTTSVWKPTPGKNVIRIVPYAHNPENPFIELLFHYNMNGRTYLSPASFGRPDPIVEFANNLKKSGDKEQWKTGRKLEPKLRTYVPVLVRGQENEGVKFWGMGKQVYSDILSIIADADYGDITDLRNGRDIVVEFKTAEETGKSFPETAIRVKPNQTPAFDPADKVVLEKVKHQKNVTELFPELSYEELATVMDTWLNASDGSPDGEATPPTTAAVDETTEPVVPAEPVTPAPAAAVTSATAKAAVKAPTTTKEVVDDFENLFNK